MPGKGLKKGQGGRMSKEDTFGTHKGTNKKAGAKGAKKKATKKR